jgi:hypothetical protein
MFSRMTFALSSRLRRRFASVRPTITMLVLVPVLNGCSETIQPSQHIIVERESLIPDLKIKPHQVIQTAAGDFILAGEGWEASAVSLSKNGELLWKYEELRDPRIPSSYQVTYTGVVALTNGDLLFCGERRASNVSFHTLTTVLSAGGKLKVSTTIDPLDSSLHAMGFAKCSATEDGALIFGSIFNPGSTAESFKPGLPWIVKVDQGGKRLWERVGSPGDEFKPPFAAARATPSGTTLRSIRGSGLNEILRLTRVSPSGDVTATHDFRCGYFLLHFDTVEPSDNQSFLCAPGPKEITVFRLTGGPQPTPAQVDLKDSLHSSFIAQLGRGYELKDGSFLVFGRIPTQTGDRALIQLFDKEGHSLGFRGYDLQYPSFGVENVYSLGNNRFLALRQHLDTGGTIMSWVRVE